MNQNKSAPAAIPHRNAVTGFELPPSPGECWKQRLSSLDADRQKQIAAKYYGGHMPWRDSKDPSADKT